MSITFIFSACSAVRFEALRTGPAGPDRVPFVRRGKRGEGGGRVVDHLAPQVRS